MNLFDRLRPQFCHMPRGGLIRQLTSVDQEERRNTLAMVMDAFKLRVTDENHCREARRFIKQLCNTRSDLDVAISHKANKHHGVMLWISSRTPNSAAILSTPEFRELNAVLNALEWLQQVTATFTALCRKCDTEVSTNAVTPGLPATCRACGDHVVRWLYSSLGEPVAYLVGEHVFMPSGKHMGNLEANQIWTNTYEGEILLDDRVMIDYHWYGPNRVSYEAATSPSEPVMPRPKEPIIQPMKVRLDTYGDVSSG